MAKSPCPFTILHRRKVTASELRSVSVAHLNSVIGLWFSNGKGRSCEFSNHRALQKSYNELNFREGHRGLPNTKCLVCRYAVSCDVMPVLPRNVAARSSPVHIMALW